MKSKEKMKYLRLNKQADFHRLFQKGKRAFSPSFTIVYHSSDRMRMGISVGKKHGKSVQRNRIKRLIREAFRKTQGEMEDPYEALIVKESSALWSEVLRRKETRMNKVETKQNAFVVGSLRSSKRVITEGM